MTIDFRTILVDFQARPASEQRYCEFKFSNLGVIYVNGEMDPYIDMEKDN